MKPRLINGCCKSVVLAQEFEKQGWDVWTCDTQPSEGWHQHIQDDILNHLNDGWDMGIFHPDCTTKANSGVRWLFEIPGRYQQMTEDCDFFNKILTAKIPLICVEHPIIHKYAKAHIIKEYSQIIQPHYFIGSNESKATCLWLVGLDKLHRTQWLNKLEIKQSVWRHPPSPDRKVNRARNSPAIARAMAEQWCNSIESDIEL